MARYQLKQRPRIGVTVGSEPRHMFSWHAIRWAIWRSGGQALRIHPQNPRLDEEVDGLVIAGGEDVSPRLYEQPSQPGRPYNDARDALELAWLHRAEREHLPVLGICRGAQLMNVSRGGTLHPDIRQLMAGVEEPTGRLARVLFRKEMLVARNSLLYHLLGSRRLPINSLHVQSIDALGKNLRISGREPNGIIQAVEATDHPFWVGVQFHPEYLPGDDRFRSLFRALVQEAALHLQETPDEAMPDEAMPDETPPHEINVRHLTAPSFT